MRIHRRELWLGLLLTAFLGNCSEQSVAQTTDTGGRATPRKVEILPEPPTLKLGEPLSQRALVARPPALPGVLSWTLETRRHRSYMVAMAASPDGRQLATGGIDGTVRIWDLATGQMLRALVGDRKSVV